VVRDFSFFIPQGCWGTCCWGHMGRIGGIQMQEKKVQNNNNVTIYTVNNLTNATLKLNWKIIF
jgi:hypothetical protein